MQLANIKDVNFIVLHGEPNAGKTTTLNELIIELIISLSLANRNNVGKIKVFEKTFKNFNDFNDNKELNFNDNGELKSYLESVKEGRNQKQKKNKEYDHIYFFKYENKSVLVITEGDDMFKLLGTLIHFSLQNKIDIVVCAAREEFLKDFVEHLSNPKLGVNNNNIDIDEELQKGKNKNDDIDMAKKILDKINNLIKDSRN